MSDPNPIDFVVGDTAADRSDEELVTPGRGPGRLPWVVVIALAAAVGVVVLVQRGGADHRSASGPASTATTMSRPADAAGVSMTPTRIPEGNRHSRAPYGCPADAECYTDRDSVPATALAALRRHFAGAQLTGASSVLANRSGRFGPDLVSRALYVRAGPTDVSVTIRKPTARDHTTAVVTRHGDLRIVAVTVVGPAFTVRVVVEQYGVHAPASRDTVDDIARDRRLVAPQ